MTNNKLFLLLGTSLSLIPSLTSAQCVATQDCATLGYTETSCSGGIGVKCPFGNKWACFKTDAEVCQQEGFTKNCTGAGQQGKGESCANLYKQCDCQDAYKYTCYGTGYSGGSGSACGGKYTQCSCASGYKWDATSGTCKADRAVCEVGTLYYSDGTCSSSKVSGKTLLGVVIYSNGASGGGWVMTVKPVETGIAWDTGSSYSTGITDRAVSASCTNTQKLVALGSRFAAANAANNYKPTGTPSGKSWCLPSHDLLNNLNNSVNFAKVNAGITTAGGKKIGFGTSSSSEYLWSSSESSSNTAWYFSAGTSGSLGMYGNDKSFNFRSVRPVLAF